MEIDDFTGGVLLLQGSPRDKGAILLTVNAEPLPQNHFVVLI
jgi:hypothetical protein